MRIVTALLVVLTCVSGAWAQRQKEPPRRHGVRVDLDKYPQASPKDALGSIIRALDEKRIDYVLAQLADPVFVDQRVRDYGGFDAVVREAKAKLVDDPAVERQLQRFLREGEWQEGEADASVGLKEGTNRVFFRKVDNRWYIENRKTAEEKPK